MLSQFNRYVNVNALKHYFNVTNSYVLNKLFLVLFPWRHKPWSRKQAVGPSGQEGWYLPPREDVNSPDMYIPVMAVVTYILLSTLIAGLRGQFQPELLGYTASTALVVVLVEIMGLKLGCYLLSISNDSQLYDLIAYSGYKFVGIIVTVVLGEIMNGGKGTGGWVGWSIFLYTFLANSLFLVSVAPSTCLFCSIGRAASWLAACGSQILFFLRLWKRVLTRLLVRQMRSLKYVLLPENGGNSTGSMQTVNSRAKRNARTQFLFFYSYIVQFLFMWILTRG